MGHSAKEQKFMRRAMGSVVTLTLWAVLLSALLLSVANDTYAFFKEEQPYSVTADAPLSPWELSRLLADLGVIDNPLLFTLYLGKSEVEAFSGSWELDSSMSYRELSAILCTQAS